MDAKALFKIAKQAAVDKLKKQLESQTEAGDVVGVALSAAQLNQVLATKYDGQNKESGQLLGINGK